jgi:alkanesulfonate monooxygenase SsuD/methylene tetrahydromethanopterin reductase-like flavin-dependent oxidoreductase (luciferase family)
MLDEALDVLTGLWSGEKVNYSGKYYQIKDARFLPTPVQKPRIPIWAAGIWPNKKPFKRAAQLDGIFPLFPNAKNDDEAIRQLKDLVNYIKPLRDSTKPLDIVFRGFQLPANDPSRARNLIKPFEELGVTWWQTSLSPREFGGSLKDEHWPLKEIEDVILKGPPIVD